MTPEKLYFRGEAKESCGSLYVLSTIKRVGDAEYIRADIVEQLIRDEREACAKVAEDMECYAAGPHHCPHNEVIAQAIRRRGDET